MRKFIPVGHISLDSENEDPNAADAMRGIYRISSFYISTALQGGGVGRAAMDEIERLATTEPLNAKTLTLGTVANDYEGKRQKWEALKADGMTEPKVCLHFFGCILVVIEGHFADDWISLATRIGMRGEGMKFMGIEIRCGRKRTVRGGCGLRRKF